MNGAMITSPGSCVLRYSPRCFTTPDLALLDDVDHLPQRQDQHHHHEADDDEADEAWEADGCDHVCSSSPFSRRWPSRRLQLLLRRQRTVDRPHDERRALHGRHEDPCARRDRRVGAADGAPALAGEPDVADPVQAPDEVEREHLLPDQASVHTRARSTS